METFPCGCGINSHTDDCIDRGGYLLDTPMCEYCQERPVFEHFTSACFKCSFTCENCEELTGYDKGMAYDELCDDCGVLLNSTPENPWRKNGR